MVQAPSPRSPTEQHFTHSVLTWEDFKTLQAVLAPSGVRVSYLDLQRLATAAAQEFRVDAIQAFQA